MVAASTSAFAQTAGPAAGEWPQFQGGPTHLGSAPGGPQPPYVEAWAFDQPVGGPQGESGMSPPVVADGMVVALTPDEVVALDLADGTERWRIDRRQGPTVQPAIAAVDDGHVVVFPEGFGPNPPGSSTDDGGLGVPATPSPAPADGEVTPVELVAVDLTDGAERWRVDLPSPSRTGVTVDAETAYVGGNDGSVTAVALDDGDVRWTVEAGGTTLAPVAVAGDLVIVSAPGDTATGLGVVALAAADGELVWRFEPTSPAALSGPPAVTDDAVILGLEDRSIRALDLADGQERWSARLNSIVSPLTSVAVGEDLLVGVDIGGQVYGLDPSDGRRLWDHALNRSVLRSAPVLVPGHVLVATQRGELLAVETGGGDLVWSGSAVAGVLRSLAVAGDLVIGVRAGTTPGLVAFTTDPSGTLVREVTPTRFDAGALLGSFALAAIPLAAAALLLGTALRRRMGPPTLADGGDEEPFDPIEDTLGVDR